MKGWKNGLTLPGQPTQNRGRIWDFNTPLPHNLTFSKKKAPLPGRGAFFFVVSLDRPVVFTSRRWTHDTRDLVRKPDKLLAGGYSGAFFCWSTRFWLCVTFSITSVLGHNRRPTNSESNENHYSHARGLVNLNSKLSFLSFPLSLPSSLSLFPFLYFSRSTTLWERLRFEVD